MAVKAHPKRRNAVSPDQQAAARALYQHWLSIGRDPLFALTLHQVATWCGFDYQRAKVLRMARWRYDQMETARTGLTPPPYIPLRTALPRAWVGAVYLAKDIEAWVQFCERRRENGDVCHARPPGRPGKI